MPGGSFDPTALPIRPGLYMNFQSAALAQITGGARGIVAIPLKTYSGTATAKTFYTVENEGDAATYFGAANIQPIKYVLQGGSKQVLVYTMPTTPVAQDYIDMRTAFDTRPFNVFVFPDETSATEQDNTLTWMKSNKADGKHFMVVFGCSVAADDLDTTIGDARSIRLLDDYSVNLISGVVSNGSSVTSGQFAPYIAGLIASKKINEAITYSVIPCDDVTLRQTNTQIKTSLTKGSLVLVNDGEKVKVEQGITTNKTKIRIIRARQAISTDIPKTASDSYVGKISNNPAGQTAVMVAIKAYLERLAASDVLLNPAVALDPNFQSVGDSLFLTISYQEVDSLERIFLTINI